MKLNLNTLLVLGLGASLFSCDYVDDVIGETPKDSIALRYIDEYVIPDGTQYQNTVFGGISGLDYDGTTWYMISDDPNQPRFYKGAITFNEDGFKEVAINDVVFFKDQLGNQLHDGITDPEAIRIDGNTIIWTSEGNINNNLPPSVNFANLNGMFTGEAILRDAYLPQNSEEKGPRHNGVFEGVSSAVDGDGYWVNMELPLKQDGSEPLLEDTDSPIRIAFIDKATGKFGKEFAYELDPVVRPATNGTSFTVNGVVEILEYEKDRFLVLERSFATGYADGGNDVKIYEVDATDATDVSNMESLKGATYKPAKKTLLFDFESVRNRLTQSIVDNIEGIAFGPDFANGNKSLVLVADNNFSAFGPQLNQFVLLELQK
ncbi:esterase-like activity of phytase family protein [Croceivirga sp. JEA036]|uniref:esterase-like activity of phytase family protein n=1 Tax=Croceivirga sp. JEA036 TaxID=2721162 RepID=UPI00143A2DBE|nr:esterase-like activity of phytase family protein [Croceivirga sp. JEA036]NJB36797.1 esterase-like activity of phytase family protein [Croceivirga sp. JEA036]